MSKTSGLKNCIRGIVEDNSEVWKVEQIKQAKDYLQLASSVISELEKNIEDLKRENDSLELAALSMEDVLTPFIVQKIDEIATRRKMGIKNTLKEVIALGLFIDRTFNEKKQLFMRDPRTNKESVFYFKDYYG